MFHHPIAVMSLARAIQQDRLTRARPGPRTARRRSRTVRTTRPAPVLGMGPSAGRRRIVCPEERRAS